jgi:multidrug efflux pump subunit AcrA (membrane-fusion protein)
VANENNNPELQKENQKAAEISVPGDRKEEKTASERKFQKRKDWIKNAIIVFLVVMLILTFFSNTIMNYSLPQVVTQYIMSGSITTKVRGQGIVESGDPYNVMVKQSRKVSGVPVKVGSQVQQGDVLVYLDEAESDETKAAKKAVEDAQDAFDTALMDADTSDADITAAQGELSVSYYRKQITALRQAVKNAEAAQKTAGDKLRALENQLAVWDEHSAELDAYNNAELNQKNADLALTVAQNDLKNLKDRLEFLETEQYYETVSQNEEAIAELKELIKEAELVVIEKQDAANTAQEALTAAKNALDNKNISLANSKADLEKQKEYANIEKINADQNYTEKKEELDKLVAEISNRYKLGGLYDAIRDAEEALEEETKNAMGGEITAPIAGTITAINVQSGKETDPATPVVVMQPEGQGYFLSFTVENDKAKLISIGDPAELVNNWWFNDLSASVVKISPDRTNPNTSKLITCEVKGSDVTVGQNLTVSIGSRTNDYDLIVPSSSIHSDTNGKYILTIESKSTPLGNRYMAKRTDVEVLASDETQSAISAGLAGWEYVITSSTKPVEAGDQVRLSEN